MKKAIYSLAIISLFTLGACKGKDDKSTTTDSQSTESDASSNSGSTMTNAPKNYTVVYTPDSAILGKSNEALVKLTGGNAVALQDADGKDNGLELNIKLQLTNKEKIGDGSSIHVDYSDSRLQLDNGTAITAETGTDYLRADPESTSKEETWKYEIPAGAKPTALNLFLDGTRVSVQVSLK